MQVLVTFSTASGWQVHLRTKELTGTNSCSSRPPPAASGSQAVNKGRHLLLVCAAPHLFIL